MQASCSNHITEPARFECIPCRKTLCEQCVKHVWSPSGFVDQCLACAALATPLKTAPAPEFSVGSLMERLVQSALFLTKPSTLVLLAGLAAIAVPLWWLAGRGFFGIIIFPIMFGIECAVYFHIVQSSAYGADHVEAPDMSDPLDDIFLPAFRYFMALVPIIVAILWYSLGESGIFGVIALLQDPLVILEHPGPGLLLLAGVLLWPLLTLIAAIGQSVGAMYSPSVWIETIRIMKGDFFIGVVIFYAIFALEILLWLPLRLFLLMELDFPFIGSFIFYFLGYIPFALRARVLGAMAQPYLDN